MDRSRLFEWFPGRPGPPRPEMPGVCDRTKGCHRPPMLILARAPSHPRSSPLASAMPAFCRMDFKCLAFASGAEPIFGQGAGDVHGYCLVCEYYVKMSYAQQRRTGYVRCMQRIWEASVRKSIKVGRRSVAGCKVCKLFGSKVAGCVCCLRVAWIARLHAFRTSARLQVVGLQGCRLFSVARP